MIQIFTGTPFRISHNVTQDILINVRVSRGDVGINKNLFLNFGATCRSTSIFAHHLRDNIGYLLNVESPVYSLQLFGQRRHHFNGNLEPPATLLPFAIILLSYRYSKHTLILSST